MSRYVVLRRNSHEEWQESKRVEAHSADHAVRQVVDEKGGTYVAIPERSFQPLTVEVEVQRKLTLSPTSPNAS